MADLRGRQIRESYRFLVGLSARTTANSVFGVGMESTERFLTDGDGVRSALRLGTNGVSVNGNIVVSGNSTVQNTFTVQGTTNLDGPVNIASLSAAGLITADTFEATSLTNGGFRGLAADTQVAPSYVWSDDTTTGIFKPTPITIGFTTSGSERLRIGNNLVRHSGTDPRIQLNDVDAPFTHNRSEIIRQNNSLTVRTLNNDDVVQSADYTINIGVSGATSHIFSTTNIEAARIDPAGTLAPFPTTVLTREKGDGRYIGLDGNNIFTGSNTFATTTLFQANLRFTPGGTAGNVRIGTDDGGIYTNGDTTTLFFSVNNTLAARIDLAGPNTPAPETIITRDKGDIRYARLTFSNTFTANNTFAATNTFAIIDVPNIAGNRIRSRFYRTFDVNPGNQFEALFGNETGNSGMYFTAANPTFTVNGAQAARIEGPGPNSNFNDTIITREKGDARYVLNTGGNIATTEFGGIGSYAFMWKNGNPVIGGNQATGFLYAGSSLRYTAIVNSGVNNNNFNSNNPTIPPGTWRLMGHGGGNQSLYVRVA